MAGEVGSICSVEFYATEILKNTNIILEPNAIKCKVKLEDVIESWYLIHGINN